MVSLFVKKKQDQEVWVTSYFYKLLYCKEERDRAPVVYLFHEVIFLFTC
jgi:hypothetical protein